MGNRTEQMNRALQDAYDLVVILLDTGARYGEIAGLEWKQVDAERRIIRLWRPKVRNESVLFMTDRVHLTLSRRKLSAEGGYIFTNKAGGPRGYASVSIRKALNRAGLREQHLMP